VLKVVSDESLDFRGVVVIPSSAFLILLIWVFFSPYFSHVSQESVKLFIFSKNQLFVSLIFFFSVSLISAGFGYC
jgi:hypothetical protein